MKSKLLIISSLAITSLALIVGCAKQGPVGPEGPNGPQGAIGVTGTTGATGATGTTNIKTMIDSVPPGITINGWAVASVGYSATFSDAGITAADSDIINVAVATSNISTTTWYPAPIHGFPASGDTITYSYSNNHFTLQCNSVLPPTVTVYFKVSVTPPQLATKKKGIPSVQSFQN